jgi:hypothetical protein
MTKRIMNDVFFLAGQNGIAIYYRDNDSLYIKEKK